MRFTSDTPRSYNDDLSLRTNMKNTGTNGIASSVEATIPPKTTVPSDC